MATLQVPGMLKQAPRKKTRKKMQERKRVSKEVTESLPNELNQAQISNSVSSGRRRWSFTVLGKSDGEFISRYPQHNTNSAIPTPPC
jgi:hypothetical protein